MVSQLLEDVSLTVLTLCLTMILTETVRAGLERFIPRRYYCLSMEGLFTFQLCLLAHELLLLAEVGKVGLPAALILLYVTTVAHYWHAAGALCDLSIPLRDFVRGRSTFTKTIQRLVAEFTGAFLAWDVAFHVHKLGITRLHSQAGSECTSNLHTSREKGAVVELGCAFVFHSARHLLRHHSSEYHVHIIAITIVCLQAAVGHLTGAMFNPALAFSINFFCKGSSLLDNIFVYWLGPIAGMILSVILFDQVLPTVRRMIRRDDVSFEKMD